MPTEKKFKKNSVKCQSFNDIKTKKLKKNSVKCQSFNDIKTIYKHQINPLPDNKILDWSKLKQVADDILKCI